MNGASPKTLSLVEAARLIYRTRSPSEDQVRRVENLMKDGTLWTQSRQGPPLRWTTAPEAIAELLAEQALHKQEIPQEPSAMAAVPASPRRTAARAAHDAELKTLYHDLWRDFFLSVFMRRKSTRRSRVFQRAVLGAQVLFLLVFAGLIVGGIRLSTATISPERAAVERWIEQHTDRYRILRWHPTQRAADGRSAILRVEYSYTSGSRRPIQTDRRFLVEGDNVREITEFD